MSRTIPCLQRGAVDPDQRGHRMGISLQGKECFPYFAVLTTDLPNPTAQDLHIWSQCRSAALLRTPLHTDPQIQGILLCPCAQQKLQDSTFLKHPPASTTLCAPTSTCGLQPQKPHALDTRCLSVTRHLQHAMSHVLPTPQVNQDVHSLH